MRELARNKCKTGVGEVVIMTDGIHYTAHYAPNEFSCPQIAFTTDLLELKEEIAEWEESRKDKKNDEPESTRIPLDRSQV